MKTLWNYESSDNGDCRAKQNIIFLINFPLHCRIRYQAIQSAHAEEAIHIDPFGRITLHSQSNSVIDVFVYTGTSTITSVLVYLDVPTFHPL